MVAAAAAATIVVIVGKHLIEQSSALFRTPDYRRAVNGLLGSLRKNRTYYATGLRGENDFIFTIELKMNHILQFIHHCCL